MCGRGRLLLVLYIVPVSEERIPGFRIRDGGREVLDIHVFDARQREMFVLVDFL